MIEVLIASFLVGLTGAVSPGPMSASILGMSHKKPLLSTAGLVAGHGIVEAAIIVGIIFGLSSLPYQTEIALLGCVTIVILGMLQFLAEPEQKAARAGGAGAPFVAGIVLTLSNPYWWIWWLTFGAGFLALQPAYAAFFIGHISADLVWFGILALTASRGAKILGDRYRWVVKGSGVAMAAFGILFAYSILSG
ncbi:MAG TPA: LysE family transporter [Methanomicrobiales archaeon]|nr:LysE family transporter [Methanomicrobiales archaeon]